MKPASATTSGAWRVDRPAASAASKASRVGEGAVIDDRGRDAVARARTSSPAASARLLITAAMRAGQRLGARRRSTIASMLEPRPEIRMTMRFIGGAVYGALATARRSPR